MPDLVLLPFEQWIINQTSAGEYLISAWSHCGYRHWEIVRAG